MSDCKLTLGERIADTLLKQGKTQTDLCNEIGMKTSTLNAIITGERKNPRIETIIPIAKGLNTSLDYLLGLSDISSLDVELRDISLKTRLSPSVVNRLTEFHLGNDRILALNDILESDYAGEFLTSCKEYLYYFPNEKSHYVVSADEFLPPWEAKLDDCKYSFISSDSYEKIMLDSVMSKLKKIKDNSEEKYNYNKKELDILKKQLDEHDYFSKKIPSKIFDAGKEFGNEAMAKAYKKFALTVKENSSINIRLLEEKINDLEAEIKKYERNHNIR